MNLPHETPAGDPPQTRTAFHVVDDALFDQHRALGYHPERPERLAAARRAVERCAARGVVPLRVASRDATDDEILRAHDPQYLDLLRRLSGQDEMLDADTYLAPSSIPAARRAAGSAVALVEALLSPAAAEQPATGIALLRPPGHHASRDAGTGFCILNNVAIAALAALDSGGVSRVAIVDFDVHHGNGTQDILWRDPRALFISLHQFPFYPGTGAAGEVGEGEGEGYTVNIPLSEGATDAVYQAAFDEIVLPILDEHAPELILVSAGFDAHRSDPLAGMELSESSYASMVRKLAGAAARTARGRLALLLEGGYDLNALEGSIEAALLASAGAADRLGYASAGAADRLGYASAGAPAAEAQADERAASSRGRPPASTRHRAELDRARRAAHRRWTQL